jgi:undecaprenyl-diphosphatase
VQWYNKRMNVLIELLKALLLGIIQGITEWLPVSSTGHLILTETFWPFELSEAFTDLFIVFIQVGSVLAVILLFFKTLYPFSGTSAHRHNTIVLWLKIVVASVPAGILGILFDDVVDAVLYRPWIIAVALILYGIAFIVIERMALPVKTSRLNDITFTQALGIGSFQVLSLVPGTSRSGSTILGALILGLSRPVAAEFSFMMAIPVLLGAGGIKLVKSGMAFSGVEWAALAVGFITAFLVSLVVMRALMAYVKKHQFTPFAYYRIGLGLVILVLVSLQLL